MKQQLAVAGNKILIEFEDDTKENKTASGIHIPDSAKQQFSLGKVIARGPEADERIQIGTKCMFLPNTGAGIKMNDGRTILCMRDIDLFYWYTGDSVEIKPSLN